MQFLLGKKGMAYLAPTDPLVLFQRVQHTNCSTDSWAWGIYRGCLVIVLDETKKPD